MENSSLSKLYKLQRLRYFYSHRIPKTFVQRPCRNKQRLIPLTREIIKAMMDFNSSHSSTSCSEKPTNNTISITSLVRCEVHGILQELSISDQFIRKEDIDELIEKCLKEKITSIQDCDSNDQHILLGDADEEYEITVEEMSDDKDKNKLLIQNIKIMEDRITTLETRLNYMIQNVSKFKHKRFKININNIKEKLLNLNKVETPIIEEKPQDESILPTDADTDKVLPSNLYDEIFYSTREYTLNLLNYKKSLETIELNHKATWNPYVRPVNVFVPELEKKFKKRSMFLEENDNNVG